MRLSSREDPRTAQQVLKLVNKRIAIPILRAVRAVGEHASLEDEGGVRRADYSIWAKCNNVVSLLLYLRLIVKINRFSVEFVDDCAELSQSDGLFASF